MADGTSVDEERTRQAVESHGPRKVLLRRLMDVVAMPTSRASIQDRAIAGDLLLELLTGADEASRLLCAQRMREMSQAPRRLLRFLAIDAPKIGVDLILENKGLDDSDLIYIVAHGGVEHRLAVARRREIGPAVATAIAESREIDAVEAMLHNPTVKLSERSVDVSVSLSRDAAKLVHLLIHREELRPAHALAMFWWCGPADRRHILMRFSAERTMLIDNCSDVFRHAVLKVASDPVLQKALQIIERRQRNRASLAASRFKSLEDAVSEAFASGVDRELVSEISLLSGIRPATGERIFGDPGGEGVAVLCKATGLKRRYLRELWAGMGRSVELGDPDFERVSEAFESMAVAKAQTVLRYWDWRLSTAYSPDAADPVPSFSEAVAHPEILRD